MSTSILYTVVKERAEAGASTGKSCLVLAGTLRAAVSLLGDCVSSTGALRAADWMAYFKDKQGNETRVDFRERSGPDWTRTSDPALIKRML